MSEEGRLLNPARISAPFSPPTGIDKRIADAKYAMEVAKRRGHQKSYRDFRKCYERLLKEKKRMGNANEFDKLSEKARGIVEGKMGKPIETALSEVNDTDFYLEMKDGWDNLDFENHAAYTAAIKYLEWLKAQGKATVEKA
jgi:hypothetical protein